MDNVTVWETAGVQPEELSEGKVSDTNEENDCD